MIGLFRMFFFRDRKSAGGVSQTDHTGCLNLVTGHLYLMGLFLFQRYLFKSSHCIFLFLSQQNSAGVGREFSFMSRITYGISSYGISSILNLEFCINKTFLREHPPKNAQKQGKRVAGEICLKVTKTLFFRM